ncbi:MAG: gluconokinase [Burkholderiales bacterium]|nr:gluconokinase [Burkholderiales bacterium]
MRTSLVMMGVAGCGKSSLGLAVAQAEGLPVVEGDDFHGEASRDKMSRGIPLTDADRDGWLQLLGQQLRDHRDGLVLTCSALKRAYRERLRTDSPGLRFVFLEIAREHAQARVSARGEKHFFAASLVDSQFATLEEPSAEAGVLRVDALAPLSQLQRQVSDWLHSSEKT